MLEKHPSKHHERYQNITFRNVMKKQLAVDCVAVYVFFFVNWQMKTVPQPQYIRPFRRNCRNHQMWSRQVTNAWPIHCGATWLAIDFLLDHVGSTSSFIWGLSSTPQIVQIAMHCLFFFILFWQMGFGRRKQQPQIIGLCSGNFQKDWEPTDTPANSIWQLFLIVIFFWS